MADRDSSDHVTGRQPARWPHTVGQDGLRPWVLVELHPVSRDRDHLPTNVSPTSGTTRRLRTGTC